LQLNAEKNNKKKELRFITRNKDMLLFPACTHPLTWVRRVAPAGAGT
jgi:hypothetical protein